MSALEDAKSWAKAYGDKVGKLFHALWKMLKNPDEVATYINVLNERMKLRKIKTVRQFSETAAVMFHTQTTNHKTVYKRRRCHVPGHIFRRCGTNPTKTY